MLGFICEEKIFKLLFGMEEMILKNIYSFFLNIWLPVMDQSRNLSISHSNSNFHNFLVKKKYPCLFIPPLIFSHENSPRIPNWYVEH